MLSIMDISITRQARVALRIGLTGLFALLSMTFSAEVELQILQTTDLHGAILSSDIYKGKGGGLLRVGTLIRGRRDEFGADGTILIDCGDTLFGSVEMVPSRGALILRMLSALDYDVWVPGNHELDLGAEHLAKLSPIMQDAVLCGNLSLTEREAEGDTETTFPAWQIIDRKGVRVAVIGMTASYTPNWFWGESATRFKAWSAEQAIGGIIAEIRKASPDLIVLAIRQGWLPKDARGVNEIPAIAKKFPEIDIILGGHTHWGHSGRRVGRHAWYVQSGRHADALAVVRVRVDTRKNEVTSIESSLLNADETVVPDPVLKKRFAKELAGVTEFAAEKVGVLSGNLAAGKTPGVNSPTSELISCAIADTVSLADLVVHGKLSKRNFPAGELTRKDLFELVPYENQIGTLSLTRRQLIAVLNEQISQRKSYVVNGLWGAYATIFEDDKVTALKWPDGREVEGRVSVAFNSYSLAGGGGRFPYLQKLAVDPRCKPAETGLWTRDVVGEYLEKNSPLKIEPVKWLVTE